MCELQAISEALGVFRRERKGTAAERDAFERFGNRVADCSTTDPSTAPTAAGVKVRKKPADGVASDSKSIRQLYRETVMAVDHFEDEYDETLLEHVDAELGPDFVAAVSGDDALTPPYKDHSSVRPE
jgi:hypothetical protein